MKMEDKYRKSKGNAGLDGVQFQLDLLIVSLLNAIQGQKDWKISSENQQAGKYDDLVLELPNRSVLLQAKFKLNKKISRDQLFSCNSKNDDFSLPKYFLSYLEIKSEFEEKTVIICTNTDINESGLEDILSSQHIESDSMLYYEGATHPFFTFNKNILPDLKANVEDYIDKNLQGKNIDKALITEESIEDFLRNLQFFSNYPSGEELRNIINVLLSRLTDSGLYCQTSYHEVYRKVEDWFKQPKGEYLTKARVKAMFSEIKSDKYCESFKNYKVSFKNIDFDFTQSKQIFLVKSEAGYLLQILKIHHALQDNKSKKVLFVDPDDDTKMQKQVIEAFKLRRYAFLVLTWPKTQNETEKIEITSKLKEILKKDQDKKVIFVTGNNSFAANEIGLEDICEIDGSIMFEDLSKDYQENLLKTEILVFQGQKTSLKKLLVTQTRDGYTKSLDAAMLEKLVRGEEVKVGVRPLDLDEDTARYYVHRTFEKDIEEIENIKHALPEESIFDVPGKVVLISDSAGVGKSTVLTKIAIHIKEKYPHLWMIRINLNDHTKILNDLLRKNKETISVIKLLNSREDTKLANQFEQFVFEMDQKVVLMLDGVDEISPDYTILILALLTRCRNAPNFAKIFVTTRPHMAEELKVVLQVDSFKLLPFTRSNQVKFLTDYWIYNLQLDDTHKEKCEQYAETLIDKMSSWITSYGYWENQFTAIPLQVRMLADIFQEKIWWKDSMDWDGCKEFLNADGEEPKLPEKFDIASLYDKFIEKKRAIFIDKGNPGRNPAANQALMDQFEECLTDHRSLALNIILRRSESLFSNCRQDNKDIKEHVLKIGIVQRLEDNFQFIHRTFAEYFVAECILRELQSQNPNVDFQILLIHEILWKNKFTIVRAFLDKLLQGNVDSLSSNIFKNYKSFTYKTDWNPVFKLAGEGYIALLQLILKSINFKVIKGKEISVGDWRVKVNSKKRNTLIDLQTLAGNSGINIKDENGDTPLHHAVKRSQWEMAKFLIEQGADINIKSNDGGTVLHLAVSLNQLEAVKYFVELGGDLSVRDGNGCVPLHLAAHRRGLDIVKYLVECGVDVKAKDDYDSTPLHFATGWTWKANIYLQKVGVHIDTITTLDELNTVKYLVECGVGIDKDNRGRTALHLAAKWGKSTCVKYFLEWGVGVNDKDNEGYTALHLSAKWGKLTSVKHLVEYGADVDNRDNDGHTALHLAAKWGKSTPVEYFLETAEDVNNKDSNATKRGKHNSIKYLKESSANINDSNSDGYMALHFAPGWDRLDIIKYLVEHNADVNIQKGDGRTVLHLAAEQSELNTVEYLVRCGVDVDVCDNDGCTPLHIAIKKNKLDTVKCLLENGANVNSTDHLGHSALHLVAKVTPESNTMNTVEYLMKHGVNINVKDDLGNTALHLFTELGKLGCVKCLVERGIDINATNNEGFTALHVAVKRNKFRIVRYLVKCGAKVSVKDRDVVKYLKQVSEGVNPVNKNTRWSKLCAYLFKK